MSRFAPLLFALVIGCASPQRFPEPVWLPDEATSDPRLTGDPVASVLRHSGPVEIVRPGAPAGYRLSYHAKNARVRSGATVIVGPGGRAELFWGSELTSVVLFGDAVAVVGDPERDEPLVSFRKLIAVELTLTPDDRIVLPGGAELRCDTDRAAGPFRLEAENEEVVRVRNQSSTLAHLSYRDAQLEIAPGDSVDVPLLSAGTGPTARAPSELITSVGGHLVRSTGRIEPEETPDGVRVRALEEGDVIAGGVRVHLAAGEEVLLSGVARRGSSGE